MKTTSEGMQLLARGSGLAVLAVAVTLVAGCATEATAPAAENTDESVIDYLMGTWGCAATVPESDKVITVDLVIDATNIALNPGEGFGDPMAIDFVPASDRWTFEGGTYIEVPAVMPGVGDPLELVLLDKAGAFAGATFTITPGESGAATLEQAVGEQKVTYNCQQS